MLAVNHYDEFLKIVELIAVSYSVKPNSSSAVDSDIIALVGPAGSGKTKIATRFLEENKNFEKLISYTTKDPTAVQKNNWYSYVPLEDFRVMCDSGERLE